MGPRFARLNTTYTEDKRSSAEGVRDHIQVIEGVMEGICRRLKGHPGWLCRLIGYIWLAWTSWARVCGSSQCTRGGGLMLHWVQRQCAPGTHWHFQQAPPSECPAMRPRTLSPCTAMPACSVPVQRFQAANADTGPPRAGNRSSPKCLGVGHLTLIQSSWIQSCWTRVWERMQSAHVLWILPCRVLVVVGKNYRGYRVQVCASRSVAVKL